MRLETQEVGKLIAATEEAETVAEVSNRRLFVVDRKSRVRYLVDTGAALSVCPAPTNSKKQAVAYSLFAANGTPIPTY